MIPVGYMAKRIATKPDWLKTDQVDDIYSVSNCTSHDFDDFINYWKHNGYWLFDSPEIIRRLAKEHDLSLEGTKFFYYEAYEYQYFEDSSEWECYEPDKSFKTNIEPPQEKVLEGYDIVSFYSQNDPEHSYLSCNHMAEKIKVNRHCLLETLEEAKALLEQKVFEDCEPGPCRIFAIYSVPNA